MDHQDHTPSFSMNPSAIIKAEVTEFELANIDTTNASNTTNNEADPLLALFINWVGPEITSSAFGPLRASETEVIKNFSDTARAVGVTSRRQQYIDEDQWDEVKMLLWRLWQIKEFDRELGQKMNVKGILIMFVTPANNFMSPIPQVAGDLKARFESQNWGVPQLIPASSILRKSKTISTQKRRSETVEGDEDPEGGSIPLSSTSSTQKGIWAEAPADHAIFGVNGCMHHIALTDSNHYEICCEKGNAAVFGHNGFQVGQCWARQVAAVRDGVHGSRQAGIYGTASDGVYSIIIAGTYAALDHDTGSRVFYSVAGALTTTDSEPDTKKYTTRALKKSVMTGTGIRVLRTVGGGWSGCPRAGMRYDGLYKAVSYQIKSNDKGGKFLQFELVRMDGQPDLDENRPTWQEKVAFERVKDGY